MEGSLHSRAPTHATVHPLVLLSAVDHYARAFGTIESTNTTKETKTIPRAVGVLLGNVKQGNVEVLNSFAVPFEEDVDDPSIWFLDHTYVDTMFRMYHKVDARENVVGWYCTGPAAGKEDINIHEIFYSFTPNPIYVIINVHSENDIELPVQTFFAVEELIEEKVGDVLVSSAVKQFRQISCNVGAMEAEEIGVSHLLRDVRGNKIITAEQKIANKSAAVSVLRMKVEEIAKYLSVVRDNPDFPMNQQILEKIQNVLNLSQNLTTMNEAFAIKSNDNLRVLYVSSLLRTILSLHELIRNKHEYKKAESEKLKEKESAKAKKKDDATLAAKPTSTQK